MSRAMVRKVMRGAAVALAVGGCALLAPSADAAITSVFAGHTESGDAIPCVAQSDGVRVCHGTDGGTSGPDLLLKSWDGAALESYVILPPAPKAGDRDGDYPLIVQSHGYGSSAGGPNNTEFFGPTADQWAKRGYAVLQLSARGFGDSCGKATAKSSPAIFSALCANGSDYVHLDDDRYEVRDIQYVVGLLVDAGIANPKEIGLTGESYGGGVSLQAATLNDRVMLPNGTVERWRSPKGTPLRIAAAAPMIPWSDLVSALLPNGHELDYQVPTKTTNLDPIGVPILSYVNGLYADGDATGTYATPGVDSQDDLTTWLDDVDAGEPYDGNATDESLVQQIARYHSALYLLDDAYGTGHVAPAPLMIANGFTDDLFPVSQSLQYVNLEHSLYPHDPVSLVFGDFGHAPAQDKPDAMALLSRHLVAFFGYYLEHHGLRPASNVTATTQTCPKTAPSGGPYVARSWSALHPGEVDGSFPTAQTVVPGSGNATISTGTDPIAGKGICATFSATNQGSGVASYRLPAARGGGYTLLGSPTIIADLQATGSYPQLDARLWDVDPATNTETLISRGVYRLNPSNPDGVQVFQLHPGAWHVAAGHVVKLELLGSDAPYYRASNGTFTVTVSHLQLRLPVHERPGTDGVTRPLAHVYDEAGCASRPSSRIARRRLSSDGRRLTLTGTASEHLCAGAGVSEAAFARERVARVLVSIARHQGNRCHFLLGDGRFSALRTCAGPVELTARGTASWSLRRTLRAALPVGRYVVRSEAIDASGHRQGHSHASTMSFRVPARGHR